MSAKDITVQDLKEVVIKKGVNTTPKSVHAGKGVKQFDRFEMLKRKSKKMMSSL